MDAAALNTLAAQVVEALKPYLPIIATKAAEEIGKALPDAAAKLWAAVRDRMKRKPAPQEATDDLLAHPNEKGAQDAFEWQLRKALAEDDDFADELRRLIGPVQQISIQQQSGGANLQLDQSQMTLRDLVGGDKTEITFNIAVSEDYFRRVMGQPRPPEDLRRATERYLQYLVDRHRYLDFKGLGVSDRVPLRLALPDLYVPLKARIELPRGETWTRDLRLAGRQVPEADREQLGERLSEPTPLLDLMQQHSGLIILGDPGAGKTTFLKYLALQLAAETSARLPVLAPLSAYANALAERDVRLDDFVAAYFRDLGADLPIGDMLRRALQAGGAVVMLDGLDEVKDLRLRDTVVRRVVDFFAFHRRAGNKFLLTSRIIGYREVRPAAEGLVECTLADFADEEIEAFVERWTAAVEKAARGDTAAAAHDAARERGELLEAIRHNPGVRRLAANPLLLTILALMKRQGVTLPERRVELYQNYIVTLLSSWNRARGLDRPPARDLDVGETIKILAPLALWMHQVNPGVGLVKQGDLDGRLEAIFHERGEAVPGRVARQFLSDVREYSGLLVERGAGQYGFIHLTFEEYLAAVALAGLGQQEVEPVIEALAARAGDPAWREVSLLTIGYLGIVQARDRAASAVVEGLLASQAGEPGEAAALAGEAVADVWPGGVTAASKDNAVTALLATMRDDRRVKAPRRARAGDVLARLGDPRPEVMTIEAMQFCYLPPGPFVMGDGEERHPNEHLTYGYWIGRFPVTNAQFDAFVEAGGYTERRYWPEAEAEKFWRKGEFQGRWDDEPRTRPHNFGEPFNLPNHPVVGVSWYEALAFCRWLNDKGLVSGNWVMTLPSEAEWEKATRGGTQIPKAQSPNSQFQALKDGLIVTEVERIENPFPMRAYPYEGDFDAEKGNTSETQIGATSAVGCFPGGASPYDILDLSGNVWEWTRSLWGKDWSKPTYGYPYNPKDGRENLNAAGEVLRVVRGGAFDYHSGSARCARRGWYVPNHGFGYRGFRVAVSPFF